MLSLLFVSNDDVDESLKREIEAMKVSRRVLSRKSESPALISQSRKLASLQRLLSDTHEFLIEYLSEGKRLTRSSAKQAYKNFYSLIVDARTAGLNINLSEQEFENAWGACTLLPFAEFFEI
jgi:hypothetical protein